MVEGVELCGGGEGSLFPHAIIDDSLIKLDELLLVLVASPTRQKGVESGEIKPVKFELIIIVIGDGVCVKCVHVASATSTVSGVLCSLPPATVVTVTFERPSYSVNESAGMVTIRVIASGTSPSPYDVRVASTELTASGQCRPHQVSTTSALAHGPLSHCRSK